MIKKPLSFILALLLASSPAFATPSREGSALDAIPYTIYGKDSDGVLRAIKTDADGVMQTSGGGVAESTTGYVGVYSSSTTILGYSGFFWDAGLGFLGVGTNTPTYLLDVNGQANFAGTGYSFFAGGVDVTGGELRTSGNRVNYNLSVYAAGTAYAMTNADAALDFGTTDPNVTVDKAGTYLVMGRVYLKYNAATYAGSQTATVKIRRTNNTAADLTGATTTANLRIITTITDTVGIMSIPPVIYTTVNANDVLAIYGSLSAAPSAGSVDATEASIVIVRLY